MCRPSSTTCRPKKSKEPQAVVRTNLWDLRALGSLIALCSAVIWAIPTFSTYFSYGNPGSVDFIQYWSAFRALQQGCNPYDGVTLHTIQAQAGQLAESTILMWNPPWTALLVAPFGLLSFQEAACAWFICSLLSLLAIAYTAPRALGVTAPPLIVSACGVIFFRPIVESLALGQLSILLALACTMILYLAAAGRLFAAGAITWLCSVKPHLFILLLPLAIAWLHALQPKERQSFLLGFGCISTATIALTYLLWPEAISQWHAALGATPVGPGAVPMKMWKTATIPSLLRIGLEQLYGYPPIWPLYVIPLLSLLLVTAYFFKRAEKPVLLGQLTPPLLCLSLALCGYGWLFDQSVLVLGQLSLLYSAWHTPKLSTRIVLSGGLATALIGSILVSTLCTPAQQHYFAWIPLLLLALLLLAHRLQRHSQQIS